MNALFTNIFGSKSAFQSLTAWGLVVFVCGETFVRQACADSGAVLPPNVCAFMESAITNIGVGMTALGLRKASN